jgi:hypothetical protein
MRRKGVKNRRTRPCHTRASGRIRSSPSPGRGGQKPVTKRDPDASICDGTRRRAVSQGKFASEKQLQRLIEESVEAVCRCRFGASHFRRHAGNSKRTFQSPISRLAAPTRRAPDIRGVCRSGVRYRRKTEYQSAACEAVATTVWCARRAPNGRTHPCRDALHARYHKSRPSWPGKRGRGWHDTHCSAEGQCRFSRNS